MKTYSSKRAFYTGNDWAMCKARIFNDRSINGEVRCELCGAPILKGFNPEKNNNAEAIVFHHVIPLTDSNVNDASIAINDNNIQILHWQCHNKVHDRFQGATRRADQKVYLITGAPCSGKTTYARERMSAGDILLDIDNIWEAVSGQSRYIKPSGLKPIVFNTFHTIEEQIKIRSGNWYQAFIIKSLPMRMDRERYAQQVGADEVITMDTTEAECLQRLQENPNGRSIEEYKGYIKEYYKKFIK